MQNIMGYSFKVLETQEDIDTFLKRDWVEIIRMEKGPNGTVVFYDYKPVVYDYTKSPKKLGGWPSYGYADGYEGVDDYDYTDYTKRQKKAYESGGWKWDAKEARFISPAEQKRLEEREEYYNQLPWEGQ
jgi:hypothetical protein